MNDSSYGLEPRIQAKRALVALMALVDARAGAVFYASGDRLILLASQGVDEKMLVGAREVWARQRDALQSGARVNAPDLVITPFRDGARVCGLLSVDRSDEALSDQVSVNAVRASLQRALRREMEGGPGASFEDAVASLKREQLLENLQRHEWNIARVSRLYRVTRTTIYDWMERLGITRERVSKRV